MKPLTDEQRKRLTLYLGGKYHEAGTYNPALSEWRCACGRVGCTQENRAFTTYEDFGKLKDKLVENGEWDDFDEWAYMKWDQMKPFMDMSRRLGQFSAWLFRPESCGLVAEYLEQKNKGGK